jgi:predicted branched-subunit amino acid permease
MKVYIVTQVCDEEYGNTENAGVFATRKEAEFFLQENVQLFHAWYMEKDESRPDMYIEEWELGGSCTN